MESLLNGVFRMTLIDPPNIRIGKPKWLELPSAMSVFVFIVGTYFLVTAGVIYDVINEPPSIGSTFDERGHQRPTAILVGRVNGQYIMEGLAAAFMFVLGGIGFIILDKCNSKHLQRLHRFILFGLGFGCVLIGFFATKFFMSIKMPGYGQ